MNETRKATTMKKYTLGFSGILFIAAFLFATVQAASALTLTFTNPSSITIPLAGTASPYPAIINVSGVSGPITDLNVTLNGLSHTFINDVGALLVGPGGQSVVLFDGVGGTTGVSNVTLVFDDQATQNLPSGLITSGSYKPTNLISPPDVFPSPAPGLPYGSLLSVFNNTNPNGAWRLFVNDFAIPDGGSIAGGFGLQVTIVPEPASLFLLALGFLTIAARRFVH
jgi:subtilisin-like proprotein convertase family protein